MKLLLAVALCICIQIAWAPTVPSSSRSRPMTLRTFHDITSAEETTRTPSGKVVRTTTIVQGSRTSATQTPSIPNNKILDVSELKELLTFVLEGKILDRLGMFEKFFLRHVCNQAEAEANYDHLEKLLEEHEHNPDQLHPALLDYFTTECTADRLERIAVQEIVNNYVEALTLPNARQRLNAFYPIYIQDICNKVPKEKFLSRATSVQTEFNAFTDASSGKKKKDATAALVSVLADLIITECPPPRTSRARPGLTRGTREYGGETETETEDEVESFRHVSQSSKRSSDIATAHPMLINEIYNPSELKKVLSFVLVNDKISRVGQFQEFIMVHVCKGPATEVDHDHLADLLEIKSAAKQQKELIKYFKSKCGTTLSENVEEIVEYYIGTLMVQSLENRVNTFYIFYIEDICHGRPQTTDLSSEAGVRKTLDDLSSSPDDENKHTAAVNAIEKVISKECPSEKTDAKVNAEGYHAHELAESESENETDEEDEGSFKRTKLHDTDSVHDGITLRTLSMRAKGQATTSEADHGQGYETNPEDQSDVDILTTPLPRVQHHYNLADLSDVLTTVLTTNQHNRYQKAHLFYLTRYCMQPRNKCKIYAVDELLGKTKTMVTNRFLNDCQECMGKKQLKSFETNRLTSFVSAIYRPTPMERLNEFNAFYLRDLCHQKMQEVVDLSRIKELKTDLIAFQNAIDNENEHTLLPKIVTKLANYINDKCQPGEVHGAASTQMHQTYDPKQMRQLFDALLEGNSINRLRMLFKFLMTNDCNYDAESVPDIGDVFKNKATAKQVPEATISSHFESKCLNLSHRGQKSLKKFVEIFHITQPIPRANAFYKFYMEVMCGEKTIDTELSNIKGVKAELEALSLNPKPGAKRKAVDALSTFFEGKCLSADPSHDSADVSHPDFIDMRNMLLAIVDTRSIFRFQQYYTTFINRKCLRHKGGKGPHHTLTGLFRGQKSAYSVEPSVIYDHFLGNCEEELKGHILSENDLDELEFYIYLLQDHETRTRINSFYVHFSGDYCEKVPEELDIIEVDAVLPSYEAFEEDQRDEHKRDNVVDAVAAFIWSECRGEAMPGSEPHSGSSVEEDESTHPHGRYNKSDLREIFGSLMTYGSIARYKSFNKFVQRRVCPDIKGKNEDHELPRFLRGKDKIQKIDGPKIIEDFDIKCNKLVGDDKHTMDAIVLIMLMNPSPERVAKYFELYMEERCGAKVTKLSEVRELKSVMSRFSSEYQYDDAKEEPLEAITEYIFDMCPPGETKKHGSATTALRVQDSAFVYAREKLNNILSILLEPKVYQRIVKYFMFFLSNDCPKKGGNGQHFEDYLDASSVTNNEDSIEDIVHVFRIICTGDDHGELPHDIHRRMETIVRALMERNASSRGHKFAELYLPQTPDLHKLAELPALIILDGALPRVYSANQPQALLELESFFDDHSRPIDKHQGKAVGKTEVSQETYDSDDPVGLGETYNESQVNQIVKVILNPDTYERLQDYFTFFKEHDCPENARDQTIDLRNILKTDTVGNTRATKNKIIVQFRVQCTESENGKLPHHINERLTKVIDALLPSDPIERAQEFSEFYLGEMCKTNDRDISEEVEAISALRELSETVSSRKNPIFLRSAATAFEGYLIEKCPTHQKRKSSQIRGGRSAGSPASAHANSNEDDISAFFSAGLTYRGIERFAEFYKFFRDRVCPHTKGKSMDHKLPAWFDGKQNVVRMDAPAIQTAFEEACDSLSNDDRHTLKQIVPRMLKLQARGRVDELLLYYMSNVCDMKTAKESELSEIPELKSVMSDFFDNEAYKNDKLKVKPVKAITEYIVEKCPPGRTLFSSSATTPSSGGRSVSDLYKEVDEEETHTNFNLHEIVLNVFGENAIPRLAQYFLSFMMEDCPRTKGIGTTKDLTDLFNRIDYHNNDVTRDRIVNHFQAECTGSRTRALPEELKKKVETLVSILMQSYPIARAQKFSLYYLKEICGVEVDEHTLNYDVDAIPQFTKYKSLSTSRDKSIQTESTEALTKFLNGKCKPRGKTSSGRSRNPPRSSVALAHKNLNETDLKEILKALFETISPRRFEMYFNFFLRRVCPDTKDREKQYGLPKWFHGRLTVTNSAFAPEIVEAFMEHCPSLDAEAENLMKLIVELLLVQKETERIPDFYTVYTQHMCDKVGRIPILQSVFALQGPLEQYEKQPATRVYQYNSVVAFTDYFLEKCPPA